MLDDVIVVNLCFLKIWIILKYTKILVKMQAFENIYLLKGKIKLYAFIFMCYCYFQTLPDENSCRFLFSLLNYNNIFKNQHFK